MPKVGGLLLTFPAGFTSQVRVTLTNSKHAAQEWINWCGLLITRVGAALPCLDTEAEAELVEPVTDTTGQQQHGGLQLLLDSHGQLDTDPGEAARQVLLEFTFRPDQNTLSPVSLTATVEVLDTEGVVASTEEVHQQLFHGGEPPAEYFSSQPASLAEDREDEDKNPPTSSGTYTMIGRVNQ